MGLSCAPKPACPVCSVERAVREQALEVLAQLLQHTPSAAADIGGEGLAGRVLLEAGHAARGSGLHLSLYTQVRSRGGECWWLSSASCFRPPCP